MTGHRIDIALPSGSFYPNHMEHCSITLQAPKRRLTMTQDEKDGIR